MSVFTFFLSPFLLSRQASGAKEAGIALSGDAQHMLLVPRAQPSNTNVCTGAPVQKKLRDELRGKKTYRYLVLVAIGLEYTSSVGAAEAQCPYPGTSFLRRLLRHKRSCPHPRPLRPSPPKVQTVVWRLHPVPPPLLLPPPSLPPHSRQQMRQHPRPRPHQRNGANHRWTGA